MSSTQNARIAQVEREIENDPEIKALYEKEAAYVAEIKELGLQELMFEIQPRWNKRNSLSDKELEKLGLLLFEYRMRGMDMGYFTCGAGASDGNGGTNCTVM